jgi:hypothetical protein
MRPRELLEELVSRLGATGLHLLEALADAFDGVLTVLTVPFDVVRPRRRRGRPRCSSRVAARTLRASQPLRLHRQRLHTPKVEVRGLAVNSGAGTRSAGSVRSMVKDEELVGRKRAGSA